MAGGLGIAAGAQALSLSELVVHSGLGQPFHGTVRYVAARGEELQPMCIRTRYVQGPLVSGLPELPDPRIDVEPGPGGGTIVVRTTRPVDEPLMRLFLAVNCGASANISREFMVALDPPRADAPQVKPAPVSPQPAPAAETRPASPIVRRPAPPPAAGAGGAAAANPEVAAAVRAEQDRRERRSRAAATGAAAPQGTHALPYEPGVTPPPGRRGTRAQAAAEPQSRFRLTLSAPSSDEPDPKPMLRSSDSLESLGRPGAPTLTEAQREKLRIESRVRLAEDPVALTLQMQDRLGGLEAGFADMRSQLANFRGERDAAAKRIAQLEEEKRSLSAWLNGMAMALGFVGCVAVAALLFWAYRRRAEKSDVRSQRLAADGFGQPEGHTEPALGEEFDESSPWRPDDEPAQPAAKLAAPARPAASRTPVTPPAARVATPAPTPPASRPAVPTPPVSAPSVPSSLAKDKSGDDSYTVTVELEGKGAKVPPVEDFYANPPRGADDAAFSLDEPPQPTPAAVPPAAVPLAAAPPAPPAPVPMSELPTAETQELPAISFDLPPPGQAGAPAPGSPAKPADPNAHGEPIEFTLSDTTADVGEMMPPITSTPAPAAVSSSSEYAETQPLEQPTAESGDPFGNDPAPPPPPGLNVTFVPPAAAREPTPTMARMKALVDEMAMAHLAEPGEIPEPVVSTGIHRTLDIDLGGDGDSEMRAQLYRQEFELKLFPEIVHGQAKLKVPQSIISLARTYYQEDFDTNRAVNLLEYAADRTPDPQRVRLALLEILRMEGLAREYVAVSRSFREQFPDAEEWETVSAYGKLLVPEEPLFKDADVTGYDLNMPSMWLGSTLDMTRYVLAQDLHDAMHGPLAGAREEA